MRRSRLETQGSATANYIPSVASWTWTALVIETTRIWSNQADGCCSDITIRDSATRVWRMSPRLQTADYGMEARLVWDRSLLWREGMNAEPKRDIQCTMVMRCRAEQTWKIIQLVCAVWNEDNSAEEPKVHDTCKTFRFGIQNGKRRW